MDKQPPASAQACPICGASGKLAYRGSDLLLGLPGEFQYMECLACGAVYQSPMPSPSEVADFYPEEYEPYKPGKAKERNPIEKAVLRTCYGYQHLQSANPHWLGVIAGSIAYRDAIPYTSQSSQSRLLDVGCGGGKYLLSMQRLGWEPQGVEFNESAVQTCRDAGLNVFQGELADASFTDDSFDVVTARHVIEHIPDPKAFVSEIFRILKPGGLMVIKTPNSNALGRGWFGTNWYANDIPRHLVLFSPTNLQLLAQQTGFKEKTSKVFSSPKIILNSWDYLTGNKGVPSKRRKMRRLLAKIYVIAAVISGRGDEIFTIFEKPR